MKEQFVKFNLWWGNRTVLHMLTCFVAVTLVNAIIPLNLIAAIALAAFLGFGKEVVDWKWGSGKFEILKAVLTALGGIAAYMVSLI